MDNKLYYSSKLKWITLICMIAVVFLHGYNYTDNFLQPQTLITEGMHFGACLEFIFANALTRFAVPMFFAISGFFFFYNKEFNLKTYGRQIKKRLKSVLLVFLIFSALSYLVCFIISLFLDKGINPMIDERMVFVEKGGFGILYPLLQNPFAFQLWFLAQLFIMSIISPVIYILVKKLKWIPLVLLAGFWLFDKSLNISTYTLFNTDAYMFFTLGAYIAVNKIKLPGLYEKVNNKYLKYIFIFFWVALSIVFTILAATLKESTIIQTMLFKAITIFGIISIWLLFDNMKETNNPLINTLKRNNFAVFLFHEPLLHLIFMTVTYYCKLDIVHLSLYFILPLLIIIGCAYFGEFLRRKCPKLNNILTGGR